MSAGVLWSSVLNSLHADDSDSDDDESYLPVPDEWDDMDSDKDSDSEESFGSIGVQTVFPLCLHPAAR